MTAAPDPVLFVVLERHRSAYDGMLSLHTGGIYAAARAFGRSSPLTVAGQTWC